MTISLFWKSWIDPVPEWFKELSAQEKGGDLWIQIGGNITETQARHLYSQWFLGKGWAMPPTENETLPKPYWYQTLRWKVGATEFADDETTWLELNGEEAIRRIWTLKGDWKKSDILPNPASCPFEGFKVHRVTRDVQLPPLDDSEFDIHAHYYQDNRLPTPELGGEDAEWKWVEKGADIQVEWTQEYVFPFHAKPTVELRLQEIREGSANDFWQHNRKAPFFQQAPRRKLWLHIPWKVVDGQNITPNARGRKSRTLVNPEKLHWNIEDILNDISTWITSLLQDLHSTYLLATKTEVESIKKDFPNVSPIQITPLTRQFYHDQKQLSGYIAQEDMKGQQGFVWVSTIKGQQEMLWWFAQNKEPIALGWTAEGWAGSLWDGVLVGNQQTIYLRDTLRFRGKDVSELPFQVEQSLQAQKKKNSGNTLTIQSRWQGVQEMVRDVNKKGSSWHNIKDLDPEWRIIFKEMPTLSAAEVAWEGLPDDEKKDKEATAWFIGEWMRTIEKETGKPVGLAPGPLTSGQRMGLTWRDAKSPYGKAVSWYFPSMTRIVAKINLLKQNDTPIVKQTERLVRSGISARGGNAIEYQPYVLARLEVRGLNDKLVMWRAENAPTESGQGEPAGMSEEGLFQVGIPLTGGVMTSFMVNETRGDILRDGDVVMWELLQWTDLDPNLFPWRPIARMPRGDIHRVSTLDEIQGAWEQFRSPITEQTWKEGRIPLNDALSVPLPGAYEISTGNTMPADIKTVGEEEEAIEEMERAGETTNQAEEYYVKREGAGAKLPWSYFHNQIVKKALYREVAPSWADLIEASQDDDVLAIRRPGYLEPRGVLVEFASGEAHDYTKWSDAAFQRVIGLEKYEVAVERSYEIIRDFQKTYRGYKPRCEFVWADMTKLVFPDRAAGEDEGAQQRLAELLPAKYMADVVGVQFALHYAAGNELDLRSALLNVSDNLKVGGFFIATFFDADRVHALLKANRTGKVNGIRTGADGKPEWSWQIQRKYQPAKWGATKLNLGHAIEVYVSSIGHSHEEYLLPMTTLLEFAKEVGLELVEQKGFEAIWAGVPQTNKHYQEIHKMSDAEKTFSFLNQAVVFQKMRNAPDSAYMYIKKKMTPKKKAMSVKPEMTTKGEMKEVSVEKESSPKKEMQKSSGEVKEIRLDDSVLKSKKTMEEE